MSNTIARKGEVKLINRPEVSVFNGSPDEGLEKGLDDELDEGLEEGLDEELDEGLDEGLADGFCASTAVVKKTKNSNPDKRKLMEDRVFVMWFW